MTSEIIAITYMGNQMPLPVSKRIGDWVLAKHKYGYDVYHAPEGAEPKSIPASAIDPTLVKGRTFLGYRTGLAALKDIAEAFPIFDREHETLLALKAFLDNRSAS